MTRLKRLNRLRMTRDDISVGVRRLVALLRDVVTMVGIGLEAQGYRRFRCRDCGQQFHERSGGVLNRTSLPTDIIAFVVFCRYATV